ncbi:MAG: SDR family oxidoreductase [Candidatus Acidiferrales bacterium]|jgi:nucleoside-diphosphate-sugar epimerase
MSKISDRKALVVGASGLAGGNLLAHLLETKSWDIVTLSRRAPANCDGFSHLPVDLLDWEQCRQAAPSLADVTHVFFCARSTKENYVIDLDPNRLIVENLLDALLPVASRLKHVQILHGMKWYGSNLGPYRTPAKESHPRLAGRNFYYEQLDAIIARHQGMPWSWSTLRPHFICGVWVGSPSNPLSILGAYAAIMKELGRSFDFPGEQAAFDAALNFTDVRLLAKAMEWAAVEPRCANEAFNIVNGDTFRWSGVWGMLADHFGMKVGSVQPMKLRDFMADKQATWAAIVARNGLKAEPFGDIADWAFADVLFEGAWEQTASVVKAHQYGFTGMVDTEEMLIDILSQYRALKLLP